MHELWREALATMELRHVNHRERDGVLPIAFSLVHLVRMEDETLVRLGGAADPLWDLGGWASRVGVGIDDPGRTRTVSEMQEQRIDDYPAFCAYADAVFARTDAWLPALTTADLERPILDEIPPDLANTYSARVAVGGPLTMYDAIMCWVHQHGIRHLGEVEHGRALVGLGGLTS